MNPGEIADLQRQEQYLHQNQPVDWSEAAITRIQDHDPSLSKVKAWCKCGKAPTWNEVAKENKVVKAWWARFDQLFLSDNHVLYLRWESDDPRKPPIYRVAAVISMFGAILMSLHDDKTAGHLGQKKTVDRAKRSPFYWPGMVSYTKQWVLNCPVCAARKNPKYSRRTPMQIYRVGTPMDRVSIDLTGPFSPRTKKGNNTILTVTDHYTRWVEAFPLREATAVRIARCVVDFICRLGVPLEIHSDQGKNVDGTILAEVCELLGVRKTHTTPYRQGNAITERENAVIKAMLAAYVNKRADDWDDHLPAVMMAYRTSVHRTLGVTPTSMMLGRQIRLPLDAMVGLPPEEHYQELRASEYAQELAEAMAQAHEVVSETVGQEYRYNKKDYDRRVRAENMNTGEAVWLREYPHIRGKSTSLMSQWTGPWIITQKLSQANLRIQRGKNGRPKVVHSDRLKKYYGPIVDEWARKLSGKPYATQPGQTRLE